MYAASGLLPGTCSRALAGPPPGLSECRPSARWVAGSGSLAGPRSPTHSSQAPLEAPLFELDPQLIVVATLAVSLLLFATDALRYDLVAALIVIVLALTGTLSPTQAYSGFADPAVILIAAMYVFSRAVNRWGIAEWIAQKLLAGKPGTSEAWIVVRVTLVSGLLSSVLSNTGIVATLIPVLSSLGRRVRIAASRLLIPLSYGSLFGGLVTLLGTSTNVAIDSELQRAGQPGLGLFEFTHLGLILLVAGALYFVWPGRLLLPTHRSGESLTEHYQVPKFVTEVLVEPSSTLMNRTVSEAPFFEKHGVSVLGIVRPGSEGAILAPGPYNRIRPEDVLIVQGEPDAIVALRKELGLSERPSVEVDGTRLDSGDVQVVEAVVPAASPLVDHTLAETDFRARTGLNVLAISQHARVHPTKIGSMRLETGDSLLIQGHVRDLDRMRESRELIVLDEVEVRPLGRGAALTLAILACVLLAPVLFGTDLSVAALTGGVALVLTGCVRPDDARRAIDWSVLLLVGGMLALGTAFKTHGLHTEVGRAILELGSGIESPRLLIAIFLVATVVLTQLTTNVTAGVIMVQVAVSAADQMGYDSRAFVMAVLTGASLAFMSPVAHQANTMVVGPGDYRFSDFLRVGTPLTILITGLEVLLLPLLWPLQPL